MASSSAPNQNVVRLKPFQFIHVLDQNTNLTRVLTGPLTYTRPEHEQVVAGPDRMIIIPARHYCRIANPVIRNSEGEVELDAHSNYKLKHGDIEIRFDSEPFPLYPGEQLIGVVEPLKMIEANNALLVRATRDHQVESQTILAGQERLVRGPGTYIHTVNEEVLRPVRATIIRQNQAIRLRALRGMTDREGNARHAGEEWLYHSAGAYIPDVTEEIVRVVDALILTDKKALHVMARRNFESFGVQRRAGESWLITSRHCEAYTPNVNEEIVGEVAITTLTNRQYCVIINPIDEKGVPQLGQRKLIVGEAAFFLHPGEAIEGGAPQNIHVLGEEEALILRARSSYNDDGVVRPPGSRWMVRGPCDYIPDVEVEILDMRRCIPLDESEGIYVRDLNSGEVRMVHGESYLLGPHEVLWEKELPPIVETLLKQGAVREGTGQKKDQYGTERSKTRVVTYRAPHNSAVQVYDYKAKCSRVIFGPELVMLGPDEHFTVLSLSGGNPKVSNQQPTLSLLLGPDFMQDQIIVETSDHAQLRLQLAYNWQFELDKENPLESAKIFSVPDFVGDCCKAVAGRVRGAVALVTFEVFHKSASDIIERAVFGENANRLIFPANNLVLTNIDIQEVEPVDQKTRESLQRSVQLTIEITTKSQEAIARRDAERKEQIARGQLDRQTIQAEAESERARKSLIELKAKSLQAEHAGQAKAEAKARAAAEAIKWTAEVKTAELEAETISIRAASELEEQKQRHESELTHQAALNAMEVDRARRLAQIEAEKFAEIVSAIGPETIKSIARAGPEMQAKLLKGLGLKSFVITDGHSPVNLLGSALGLLGAQSSV